MRWRKGGAGSRTCGCRRLGLCLLCCQSLAVASALSFDSQQRLSSALSSQQSKAEIDDLSCLSHSTSPSSLSLAIISPLVPVSLPTQSRRSPLSVALITKSDSPPALAPASALAIASTARFFAPSSLGPRRRMACSRSRELTCPLGTLPPPSSTILSPPVHILPLRRVLFLQ